MDAPTWTLSPVIVAFLVGAIGLIGFVAAVFAAASIYRELGALRRGRESLRDLLPPQDPMFDYRAWLGERGPAMADSHFADHLLAAADAARSGRAITLNELHEVSARREARRLSARLSGGVAALLLILGILGTLWAIKPLLGGFALDADAAGIIQAAKNAELATRLIRDLSQAFLPSLVALGLTVLVAFVRGFYAHGRGGLAGELDRLDLEDLFPRFPPPSVSRELDAIRAQLGDLVARMLASQHDLDQFVSRLSDAAAGFHGDAPPLTAASIRLADAADQLIPRLDRVTSGLDGHLGPGSPLVGKLDALADLAADVRSTAQGFEAAGRLLEQDLAASHRLLQGALDELPGRLEAACHAAGSALADATSNALATACSAAVARLDQAAAPMREAAQQVAAENQRLRADLKQAVEDTHRTLRTDVTAALDAVRRDLETGLDAMKQDFRQALAGTVTDITKLHGQAVGAIGQLAATLAAMEQLQRQLDQALAQAAEGRQQLDGFTGGLQSASAGLEALRRQVAAAVDSLHGSQGQATDVCRHLAAVAEEWERQGSAAADAGRALAAIGAAQRETTQAIEALLGQAQGLAADWRALEGRMDDRSQVLDGILTQGRELADRIDRATLEAKEGQERLAGELESLARVLDEVQQHKASGRFGRIFGNRP